MNYDINKLKKSDELALFLGMFAGDGCLTIGHNGFGYRTYPIVFVNTNKKYIEIFKELFYKLFQIEGKVYLNQRENKKDLWYFQKCSFEIHNLINKEFEIPTGKKCYKVSIPSFILDGSLDVKKHFFLGYLITDGSLKKDGSIMFHCSSQDLLQDLKNLINSVWGFERNVREFIQRDKFFSYQLTLNKAQSNIVLSQLPRWHNLVLRGF